MAFSWLSTLSRIDSIVHDLRFALRALWRDRAFALVAVTMLTAAIGANVAVFTVMKAMVYRGLPLAPESNRLVYIDVRQPGNAVPMSVPYTTFEAWRSRTTLFEGLAFGGGARPSTFRDRDRRPVDMAIQSVSANTFALVGVKPLLGRDFVAADEAPGAAAVTILSYDFWESQFEKNLDIVGTIVEINGMPVTIVGVMPEGFVLVYEQNLWMPLSDRTAIAGNVFGRLRDGATLAGARTELETIRTSIPTIDPPTTRESILSVLTYSESHVGADALVIYGSLWVGAWFVLVIACANLANLTLARALGRRRELAIRLALGSGRRRMVRHVVVESLILAGIAGALAWCLTLWSIRTWAEATKTPYLALDYSVDSSIFAYLIAISAAVAILIAVPPIIEVMRLGGSNALRVDAGGITQDARGKRWGAALVIGQMALAIVLLSGASVLARSFVNIVAAETGVRDPDRLIAGSVTLPSDSYTTAASRLAYFDRLRAHLQNLPGVTAATIASTIPVNWTPPRPIEVEGRTSAPEGTELTSTLQAGEDYFGVVGAAPLSGRAFDAQDDQSAPVAIVNEAFVARFFDGQPPLGKRLRFVNANAPDGWRTVVGVVPNIMQAASGDATRQKFVPLVYVPFRQQPARQAYFLARTEPRADTIASAVRAEVQGVEPDAVLTDFGTLKENFAFDRDRMDLAHAELGKHAAVAPVFAALALLLAASGLYAVIAHSVSQRTKEIGVRVAIGAAKQDVRRLILREGMQPVGLGLSLGIVAALAVNRVLQSQLVAVSPYDLTTFIAAPTLLIGVALLACLTPARRAMRVDPIVALKCD
jgi:predicted permease